MEIRELIARRSDLGTFLVHLTKAGPDGPRANLESILRARKLEARSAFGHAVKSLQAAAQNTDSQRVVCFTETPLEHVHLLTETIVGRADQFMPYGIAIPKRTARKCGVNPIWYLDQTPGHPWLSTHLNRLVDEAIAAGLYGNSHISRLTPFIEQMGTWDNHRKEFWWEREWRHAGDFSLPNRLVIICPEAEGPSVADVATEAGIASTYVDAHWGIEEIIGHLAGFSLDEIRVL